MNNFLALFVVSVCDLPARSRENIGKAVHDSHIRSPLSIDFYGRLQFRVRREAGVHVGSVMPGTRRAFCIDTRPPAFLSVNTLKTPGVSPGMKACQPKAGIF